MTSHGKEYDTLESVEGISRKGSPPWWIMAGDQVQSHESYTAQASSQSTGSIDSISSAKPVREVEVEVQNDPVKTETKSNRSLDITQWGKKIWELLCAPFGFNTTAAATTTGTSNKPGGDSVTGLGSPTLEPPFQIDLKKLEQLIKELKELNHQIQNINNESEEELKKERLNQSIYALVEYYKTQKKLREDVTVEIKWQIIFHRSQDMEIRKEHSDADKARIETDKTRQFWSNVNKGLTVVSVATTVVGVGALVYVTWGAGAIAIPSIVQFTANITKCGIDLGAGGTQLVKSILDKKVGGLKEKIEVLNATHLKITFTMQREVDQMNEGWNCAERLTKEMIDLLKNYREAVQSINARQ
jgi:hypothetical protein